MQDGFGLTILIIFIVAMTAAFIRRTVKDKCLKSLSGYPVVLEIASGKLVWGILRVENTGFELTYDIPHQDVQGHTENSFLLYKSEYDQIIMLSRFENALSSAGAEKRRQTIDKIHHPGFFKRSQRKVANFFNTLKDSVLEVVDLVIGQAKRSSYGSLLASNEKYVSKLKTEVFGSFGTSFEPLLERHIGNRVVLEVKRNGQIHEYCGILKEYTADFIELMDVTHSYEGFTEKWPEWAQKTADLVAPRRLATVRHLAE
ncbi:MAG: hypothetical protein CVV64_11055 [Candidatus Wallbacteria bacterium HGW-Wallbacteria-1]|jgi:small nuclear ribonucleoprotein (snRNP)-like protein|uniref:Uncharacterized protein n=1 Tax=Candidatus Wallbacteria bacterium HGW-Wallbacteria-1 TaxID=2013854 RepID=A0A2N1PP08_9BACT|nr:MAG: hypothetical protein CVV64_11055 [Candidatus Wallbacteria bacterium HGW-Wallbacteria-1]